MWRTTYTNVIRTTRPEYVAVYSMCDCSRRQTQNLCFCFNYRKKKTMRHSISGICNQFHSIVYDSIVADDNNPPVRSDWNEISLCIRSNLALMLIRCCCLVVETKKHRKSADNRISQVFEWIYVFMCVCVCVVVAYRNDQTVFGEGE